MSRHLTDRQIVEHLYQLSGNRQAARATRHLDGCARCRERAEQLRLRLAALDGLREAPEAGERLIADTLRRVRLDEGGARPEAVSARWAWTAGLAAAAALMLVLVAAGPFGLLRSRSSRVAMAERMPEAPAAEPAAPEPAMEVAMAAKDDKPAAVDRFGHLEHRWAAPAREERLGDEALVAERGLKAGNGLVTRETVEEEAAPANGLLMDMGGAAGESEVAPDVEVAEFFAAEAEVAADEAGAATPEKEFYTLGSAVVVRPEPTRKRMMPIAAGRRAAAGGYGLSGGWEIRAPSSVAVEVGPALAEPSDRVSTLLAEGQGTATQWRVSAVNSGTNTAAVHIERAFDTTNWSVVVEGGEATVTRPNDRRGRITVDVPPGDARRLLLTVILAGDDAGTAP